MPKFELVSDFKPAGDQPKAIEQLVKGVENGERFQTLLGATGTGKTFVMSHLVERTQKPTLVLAHNKTLAAQLCTEFREFFPNNAISYFVSYYDYYQPEAYVASTDTFIEKDASINEEISKFRHAATTNLMTRKDVLIVASVSCIYGLGSVDDYEALAIEVKLGEERKRDKFLRHLTDIQFTRSNIEFKQGMFNVLGDTVEVFPADRDSVFRFEFFGDELDKITEVDSFTGEFIAELESVKIFPAKHDITTREKIERASVGIRKDLEERYHELLKQGKNIEAERIKTRTEYDLEMMLETGYCQGIENYTRYLSGREAGDQPATLLDYFPDDFLMIIDESHISVPQVGGMYAGNFSRKQNLVNFGFRMPSSHDNRPLTFEEFEGHMKQVVFVSATPSKYEYAHTSKKNFAEQIIRPTGLIDPLVEVRPVENHIDDLMNELQKTIKKGDRALITTLTKRQSEELTDYLLDADMKVKYLHSDIDTMERIEILRDLRLGKIDIVVGINLLREGLDLPEVSLIAILDAHKEGFLRSKTALIQTIGRAARNVDGHVVMYASRITASMKGAIDETERRREIQIAYNKKHGITPETIKKAIKDITLHKKNEAKKQVRHFDSKKVPKEEQKRLVEELEVEMDLASQNMEFEKAAEFRDEIERLREEFGL